MKLKRKYTWAWAAWGAWFIGWELAALLDSDRGDTLSEHVWAFLSLPVVTFPTAGLLVWLVIHFLRKGNWKE